MPVEYGRDSNYAKEMRQWEASNSEFGPAGRPYTFLDYPKMLYKAERTAEKGVVITESKVVHDSDEQRNMESRGFHFGQDAAIQAITVDEQRLHGTLAAEREWEIQHGRISEKATAEVRAHEADHGARHLPMIPETPIKRKYTRKAKTA